MGKKKKKMREKKEANAVCAAGNLWFPLPANRKTPANVAYTSHFVLPYFGFPFLAFSHFFFSFSLVFILVLSGTGALAQTLECIQSQIKNEFCSHAKKVCLLSACRRKFKECWNNWNISVGFRWCFPFIRNCLGSLGEVVLRNQNCLEGGSWTCL